MGMFSCFQSPRRTRECSACSPCWSDRIRRYISPDSPIVRQHNHSTHFTPNHHQHHVAEARNPFPPRRNPSPPRQVIGVSNPSPPPQPTLHRNPSPPRQVIEVRNSSPPRQPTHHRHPSPLRRGWKLGPRFYSPPRTASRTKYRDYSPPREPSRPKHRDYSPHQISRNIHRDDSPRQVLRAKPRDKTPRRRRANKIEPGDYSPPRQAAQIDSRDSPPHKTLTSPRVLPPGSPDSSPSRNAAPERVPAPLKIHHGLKNDPPVVLPARPDSSNRNVSQDSQSPVVHHHHFREPQMRTLRREDQQEHHTHVWVDHDADHVHEWVDSDGRNLAEELQREAAFDREQQARGQSGSSRSVTESCADSYCTRAENPLRQQKDEPKFPFGTPENRPISPPGWTYSPKRKTSRGQWWDKDWPKNKRYVFYDPNLQPCGCHWSKRHARSTTPSPPTSARARGIAYADGLVKINRDRSLSPRTRSRQGRGSPRLVPAKEPPLTRRHRHEHLNWSCDTSRASSRPASRPITPKEVYTSGRSTPFRSRPQSPRSSSPKLAGCLAPRNASSSGGCCVSFSQSTTPARKQKPYSSRPVTPRPVRSRASAPIRQRPQQHTHTHIYVSSSSGCSTPTSIRVQSPRSDGSSRTVTSMGHCHTYGSWNCSPYEDPPGKKTRTPTPPRTPDYTVTITCPQNEESIACDGKAPEVETMVPWHFHYHCPCSVNHDHCHPSSNVVIGGSCDWHHVAHHHHQHQHHRADHCCCGYRHCDW